MTLAGRVRRLERARAEAGGCPLCGGVRTLCVVVKDQPDPEPCPGCGAEPLVVRIAPVREERGPVAAR